MARALHERIVAVEADISACMVTLVRTEIETVIQTCVDFMYNSMSVQKLRDIYDIIMKAEETCLTGRFLLTLASVNPYLLASATKRTLTLSFFLFLSSRHQQHERAVSA
jgi:hypothetical protein